MDNVNITENEIEEFESLALPHMDKLYSYALKMTRSNEDDAGDLVQDTYLRAFRFFDTFIRGTNFKAWLFKILKNVYINKYRVRIKTPLMVDIDSLENLSSRVTPETEIFDKLLDDDISSAIDALSEEFRVVIVLCDLEGLSYKDVAEILGCPIGTVMSRLHRGRKLLRKKDDLRNYAQKKYGYGKQDRGLS